MELVLTNARVVTRDAEIRGSVHVKAGKIAAVDEGRSSLPGAVDLENGYLIPGLVEMHTDNVEKHFQPRPGVLWPSSIGAVAAHDTQIAGAGITTVLDAISVGEYREGSMRRQIMNEAIGAVRHASENGLLRAEHMFHLRCEIADEAVLDMFEQHVDDPLIRLVSIMDHTPGQRQWRDLAKYRQFHRAENMDDAEFHAQIDMRREVQQKHAAHNRQVILDLVRYRDIPLASHDDTTEEHVLEAVGSGITISEFPTSLEAARKAREHGMGIIMGAPNLVRGGSHSGNVSAGDLAEQDLLDGLSSDYMPASLLHSAFKLNEKLGVDLPAAIATVSANVARMVRLNDRGAIEPGKRADLVHVRLASGTPVVQTVWREGRRIA